MSLAIWWIRRDLRLADNPALHAALSGHDTVLPVFVLDPALLKRPAPKRQAFLMAGLRRLDSDLRRRGSRLVVLSGAPLDVLEALVAESGAQAIYACEDYSPYARRRDESVAGSFQLNRVLDVTIHHPVVVRKPDGRPYLVFSAFARAWKNLPLPEHVAWLPPAVFPTVPRLPSEPLQEAGAPPGFQPGEDEARRRLARFLDSPVYAYAEDRNRLDLEGTSALSPYLHFGMLSPLQAFWAVQRASAAAPDETARFGCQSWINELIWREFYHAVLYYFPEVLKTAYQPALRSVRWRDAQGTAAGDLRAWQQGRTGYPIVDACMRQLAETGWMHNRGRMIAASFLCKDLLINWQEGERWFMRQLIDGNLAANNGGWQWTAGVGVDAAPYFRIFNPVLQGKKFDPHGAFVRRWVPELAALPEALIHEPWLAPRPIPGYPAPIVDHKMARERALDAYRNAARKKS